MAAPALMAVNGVGPDVAGALLVAVGDNPERLRSEASFASLCGASPVKTSSGKTQRHRLNRGGDRLANNALWRIVMVRIAHHHESTERYMDRRVKQGLSKLEVIRCLKRFVAREVYRARMVRPESWTRPAGGSPARVGAGAPGSRPQPFGETRAAERGVKSLFGGSKSAGRNVKGILQPRHRNNGGAEPLMSRRRPRPAGPVPAGTPVGSPRGRGSSTCSGSGPEQERPVCAAVVGQRPVV